MVYQSASDAQGSLFEVQARRKGQKLILFERVESKPTTYEDSESETKPPQFSHYEPNVLRMMDNIGYDLTSSLGLNFGKGSEHCFDPSFQKGKPLIIITELAGGWAMCQLQSCQPLNLKSHYTIITHLAHHRGNQTLVWATSSENFQ